MKIAHVVTYISPDGAFGGPVRVALGQAEALASRGHEVTVYAASPDDAPRTSEQDGYRLRTFPARRIHRRLGFAGMYAPGLTKALKADLADLDVVHVHMARDLVTLPAARAARKAGVRLVVQPHGMIDRSSNPLAGPIDAWEVRAALRAAAAVLTLTEHEADEIQALAPHTRTSPISNGIKVLPTPGYGGRDDVVLFLARLHERKRPEAFVQMSRQLVAAGSESDFILAGPDEGQAVAVQGEIESLGLLGRTTWIGPVDPAETAGLLRRSRVYVLPSVNEVFPMSILEAFAAGTPVVTTSSLGIAEKCLKYGAAIITDGSPAELAEAVTAILADDELATGLREGANRFVRSELSIDAVVDALLRFYPGANR